LGFEGGAERAHSKTSRNFERRFGARGELWLDALFFVGKRASVGVV
jgi:hypothetical protein